MAKLKGTKLSHYHNEDGIHTRDTWKIPAEGAKLWSTWCPDEDEIKPHNPQEDCEVTHVELGKYKAIYHQDQLMQMLIGNSSGGHQWGIRGVEMERETYKNGTWTKTSP